MGSILVEKNVQSSEQRNKFQNSSEDCVSQERGDAGRFARISLTSDEKQIVFSSDDVSSVSCTVPFRTQRFSDGLAVCRICHGGEFSSLSETLISPCHCSGTMGLYHRSCLETWLSTSNTVHCEICNFQFVTERRPKPFSAFLANPGNLSHRRSMIGDVICWCILTPLAVSSAFLCIQGAVHYSRQGKNAVEVPGLVCLAVFLLITYLIWLTVSVRYHYKVWREWQKGNQVVKILDGDKKQSPLSFTLSTDGNNNCNMVRPETANVHRSHSAMSVAARPPAHTSTPADGAPSATVTIRFHYETTGFYDDPLAVQESLV